jgi:hypothetical protein
MASTHVCAIPECGKPRRGREWCRTHYSRWLRHGDPMAGGPVRKAAAPGEPMRFLQEVAIPYVGDGCLIWPYSRSSMGRGNIRVGNKAVEVNRLVCEGRHGPPSTPDLEAAHNCGNGHLGCCNPGHLRWDTHTGNQRDRVAHGTSNRGERAGNAKLTEPQVREILKLKGQMSRAKIGKQFGVHGNTVAEIHARRNWFWVEI